MARVTYGALVTDLAGSIGGITFQKNSSGAIARSRASTPVNPSIQQSTRQLALIQLVALWATLTLTQKTAWNDLAKDHNKINDWGRSVKVSGYQWFISYNLNAFNQDLGPYLIPAEYVSVDPVEQFTLTADVDGLYINFDPGVGPFGQYWGIYATVPMRQTSIKLRKSTFLLQMYDPAPGPITQIDITTWYEELFNIVWPDFFSSAQAAIIVRMKNTWEDGGYVSPFTSNIILIG